jgi:hypothetical protein
LPARLWLGDVVPPMLLYLSELWVGLPHEISTKNCDDSERSQAAGFNIVDDG